MLGLKRAVVKIGSEGGGLAPLLRPVTGPTTPRSSTVKSDQELVSRELHNL